MMIAIEEKFQNGDTGTRDGSMLGRISRMSG